jgi:hypothetical protein
MNITQRAGEQSRNIIRSPKVRDPLPIMEKDEQFLRVIGIFALLCSHYKLSL